MGGDLLKPRVGHIDFLNVLPLKYAWQHGAGVGLDIVRGVPAELNARIIEGELDVSNVSSILYARHADALRILPDVCVSTDGAVESILLISRVPIEDLAGAAVALTAKSATSHALLKIILSAYGVAPEFSVADIAPESPLIEGRRAALLIGDDALWCYHHRQAGLYYYDLGAEWQRLTGKRMVYALWVASREFARAEREALRLVHARIKGALYGYAAKKRELIRSVLSQKPFSYEELDEYIGGVIRYELTGEYLAGLREFYTRAAALGLIPSVPELRMAF